MRPSEPKYDLDQAEIGKRFRDVQKQVHPDKFAHRKEEVDMVNSVATRAHSAGH
jgi:curved DNA-binding protein CbpA